MKFSYISLLDSLSQLDIHINGFGATKWLHLTAQFELHMTYEVRLKWIEITASTMIPPGQDLLCQFLLEKVDALGHDITHSILSFYCLLLEV